MKSVFEKSIFSKVGIFPVMLFCILILWVDVWSIYDVINRNLIRTATWWIIFLAISIFFWNGWRAKLKYEKVACYIFSIRFFLESISQFAKKEVIIVTMFFCLVLDICATISFWVCYKKFFQGLEINKQQRLKQNLKGLKILLILLAILLLGYIAGTFFVWFLHMIRQ